VRVNATGIRELITDKACYCASHFLGYETIKLCLVHQIIDVILVVELENCIFPEGMVFDGLNVEIEKFPQRWK
jgi:hypothetical protein